MNQTVTLKEYKESRNLTLAKLSKESGISLSMLSKLITGNAGYSDNIIKILTDTYPQVPFDFSKVNNTSYARKYKAEIIQLQVLNKEKDKEIRNLKKEIASLNNRISKTILVLNGTATIKKKTTEDKHASI